MEKIVCIYNQKIGETIINYYCEFYDYDYILSGGIKAANGWHREPEVIKKYSKKPYKSKVMTKEDIEKMSSNYIIEYIQ